MPWRLFAGVILVFWGAAGILRAAPAAALDPQPERSSFTSRILGRAVPFEVLPPPGYSPDATNRFPVLYWLPDRSDDSNQPALLPGLVRQAILDRILPPLFVVYVRYGAEAFYTDAASGLTPAATTLVHELIPAVDRSFRTLPDRDNRAIQGMGRGGFGAIRFAIAHPDTFGSAASYSGVFHTAQAWANQPALREDFREIFGSQFERAATNQPAFLAQQHQAKLLGRTGLRLVVGHQDRWLAENRALRDVLRQNRLAVEWAEIREPITDGQPLPPEPALEGLEFAVSWLGTAKSTDRDGPWVNPPSALPPRLRHHVVYSALLERPVGYSLYLPPAPAKPPTNGWPVVYHLHGRDEDEGRHLETTGYLDVALRLGETQPFAWVWLYGGRGSWFMDSADGRVPAESVLLEEVIPQIEARWNLGGSPARRAVDGWGMGGFGALRYAARNPEMLGAAVIHNPVLPTLASLPSRFPDAWMSVFNTNPTFFSQTEPFRLLTQHADALRPLVRFRIVAGERSPALADARRLRDHLEAHRFATEFEEVPGVAGTGPDLFRQTGLRDIQFLGKAVNRPEP
jgi:S-formylglutathione hydrolase FrmB